MSINATKTYEAYSFEELRLGDYVAGRGELGAV